MSEAQASFGGTSPLVVVAITTTGTSHIYLHGHIDPSNHQQLVTTLAGIDLDGVRAVRLNLAAVTLCDRDGAQLVLDFTRTAQTRGLPVTIEAAPAALRTA
jgi:ABC-type transporter Mla MlaB component